MNNIQITLNHFKALQIISIYFKLYQIYKYLFIKKILHYVATQYARLVAVLTEMVDK